MVYQDLEANINPLASLFIFTYNQEHLVAKTIESLLAQQTNFHFEIIIAEDCSKDKTLETCLQYYESHKNIIRVVGNEKNKGIIRNFHESIANFARGKYIACVAGDDWWHDCNKVQKQVDFLENNPEYGLVFSNTYIFSQNTQRNLPYRPIVDSCSFNQIIIQNCIPALTTCYRKSIFDAYVKDVDPINENFPGEDYPMWIWVAFHSKIHHINEPLSTYRLQSETLSHSTDKNRRVQFEIDRLNIKLFFYHHFHLNDEKILHDIYLMFYFLTLNSASEANNTVIENERSIFFRNNRYRLLSILSALNSKYAKFSKVSVCLRFIMDVMMKFKIIDHYYLVYRKISYDNNRG